MRFARLIFGPFPNAYSLHLATGVVLERDAVSISFTIDEWRLLLALVQDRDSREKSPKCQLTRARKTPYPAGPVLLIVKLFTDAKAFCFHLQETGTVLTIDDTISPRTTISIDLRT